MKTRKVIAALRKHKGPAVMAALIRDDVMYVQIVKADLIRELLRREPDGQILDCELRHGDGYLYVDSCDGDDDD